MFGEFVDVFVFVFGRLADDEEAGWKELFARGETGDDVLERRWIRRYFRVG